MPVVTAQYINKCTEGGVAANSVMYWGGVVACEGSTTPEIDPETPVLDAAPPLQYIFKEG